MHPEHWEFAHNQVYTLRQSRSGNAGVVLGARAIAMKSKHNGASPSLGLVGMR